jgi:hypothetical protein
LLGGHDATLITCVIDCMRLLHWEPDIQWCGARALLAHVADGTPYITTVVEFVAFKHAEFGRVLCLC